MTAMTVEQVTKAGKDLGFAKIWAALMKTNALVAECQMKTDAQIAIMSARADKAAEVPGQGADSRRG